MKPFFVLKFGGTSMGRARSLIGATDRVAQKTGMTPLIVVSAICGATDLLSDLEGQSPRNPEILNRLKDLHLSLAKAILSYEAYQEFVRNFLFAWQSLTELTTTLRPRQKGASLPDILAFGELQASQLFHSRLRDLKVEADWFDARDFLVTERNGGRIRPLAGPTSRQLNTTVKKSLAAGRPIITQGFIGRNQAGKTTVFGRGGSDYTATFLGAQLGAHAIQIWTDVSGVYEVDPRLVPRAEPLQALHPQKAHQLATHGAKVLYPHCLEPLLSQRIPVEIRNTFKPEEQGSLISQDADRETQFACITVQPGRVRVRISPKQVVSEAGFNHQTWSLASSLSNQWDWFSASKVEWQLIAKPSSLLTRFSQEMATLAQVQTSPAFSLVHLFGGRSHQRLDLYDRSRTILQRARIPLELINWASRGTHLLLGIREDLVEKAVDLLHRYFCQADSRLGNPTPETDFETRFQKSPEVAIGQ